MLRIRLRRTGAKKQPRYRVVVAESSAPRDGAFVEVLGWYNPQANPAQVVINTEKATHWIARGAQPSDRVARLLKQVEAGEAGAPEPVQPEPVAAAAIEAPPEASVDDAGVGKRVQPAAPPVENGPAAAESAEERA